jgi:cytochrome bd-type quinol oxidase subunit 2
MVNLLETLYVLVAVCFLIAGLAWVQSRSGGERRARYLSRMRRFLTLALIGSVTAIVWYVMLRRQ